MTKTNMINDLVSATSSSVFSLGEYNRLQAEGKDLNWLQKVRRQAAFARVCRSYDIEILVAVDLLEAQGYNTSPIWTDLFTDTHGGLWIYCSPEDERAEAFGPCGSSRRLTNEEYREMENLHIEVDTNGWRWVFCS